IHSIPVAMPDACRGFGVKSVVALIVCGSPNGWRNIKRYSVRKRITVVGQVCGPPTFEVFGFKIVPQGLRQQRLKAGLEKTNLLGLELRFQAVLEHKCPRAVVE